MSIYTQKTEIEIHVISVFPKVRRYAGQWEVQPTQRVQKLPSTESKCYEEANSIKAQLQDAGLDRVTGVYIVSIVKV
jgi:hypothetical protein